MVGIHLGKKGGEVHIMKRAVVKKRRITVHLVPGIYVRFRRFAKSHSWSDGKAGMILLCEALASKLKSKG